MDAREAEERVGRLLASLDEVVGLLSRHGEDHRARWMSKALSEVRAHDAHGLQRPLSAYGGMGSFNDLALTHINGHRIDPRDEIAVNQRVQALRSTMYSDALALVHDLGV